MGAASWGRVMDSLRSLVGARRLSVVSCHSRSPGCGVGVGGGSSWGASVMTRSSHCLGPNTCCGRRVMPVMRAGPGSGPVARRVSGVPVCGLSVVCMTAMPCSVCVCGGVVGGMGGGGVGSGGG